MHCIYNSNLNRFYVLATLNLFKFNLLRAFLEGDLLCDKNENHNKAVASGHFVFTVMSSYFSHFKYYSMINSF